MNKNNSMAGIIVRTYMLGAVVLLTFFGAMFYQFTLYTEDMNSERRLAVVSPYHFDKYKNGQHGVLKVDPILSIYDDYANLPILLQQQLTATWLGSTTIQIDNVGEFNVLAQKITINSIEKTLYAVEDIETIEWDDIDFLTMQLAILGGGLLLFLIASTFIIKTAKQISEPISHLSYQLEETDKEFSPLVVESKLSDELSHMLIAINSYRERISNALTREKSFTRYISHELRTPMTVIKGSLSVLTKKSDTKTHKYVNLIGVSLSEMEQLTQTFLQLAREETDTSTITIDEKYINHLVAGFEDLLNANEVNLNAEMLSVFTLNVHPLLFSAVVTNLLKNAINCSLGGQVSLFVSSQGIDVIDNGVGLESKPRGYEGFGIGLKIVRDICDKYGWTFILKNNANQGCTASIQFNVEPGNDGVVT